MKKIFKYAMMGAIALTGAVSFSACSSSDEVVDVNPTYDGESVKTSFTISIGDVKAPTRMSIADVQGQGTPVFQGMTDIYLFPFTSAVTSDNASTTTIEESYIHLAEFSAFNTNLQVANGKIYNDVNLSVGVNHFLFYGAIKTQTGKGKLKPSYLGMSDNNWAANYREWAPTPINQGTSTVDGITFDLVPIKRGWTIDNVSTEGATTIAPLNAVDKEIADQILAATTASATAVVTELEKIQKTLRNELTSGTYTAYAGSSKSILSLMQMLYATLKNQTAALTAGGTDYAAPIIGVFNTYFTPSSATGEWTLTWLTDPGFPANLGVPDGAAAVQFVGGTTNKFGYVVPVIGGLAATAINNYTYPARLYYTVNTPSMVKNEVYLDQEGNKTKTWEQIKYGSDGVSGGTGDDADNYTESAITASTRSVIMKDQVQYAVGRLDVQVRVKPETIINDNSADAPQPVTVPGTGYQLTGVLIGGQKQVGWDFTPVAGATEMTIWDDDMTSNIYAIQGSAFSDINHTLALETPSNTAVNIALEFENTGNDFCGIDHNLIPAGTKFYLVAQLDPTSAAQIKSNPNNLNQVFKQDYITTAKLTIGENSLKNAYNVVPDLRSPKLEFGLSVNLEWRPGITFEVEFQ